MARLTCARSCLLGSSSLAALRGPRLPRGSAHQSPAHRTRPAHGAPPIWRSRPSISPLKEPSPQVSLPCWQVELTAPVPKVAPSFRTRSSHHITGSEGAGARRPPARAGAAQKVINYGSCSFGCFPSKNISGSASVLSEEGLHSPHPGGRGWELEKWAKQAPPALCPREGPNGAEVGAHLITVSFPLTQAYVGLLSSVLSSLLPTSATLPRQC